MKTNYLSLLEEVKKEHENHRALSTNSRTLIVDGLNTFIRSFSASPDTNENGVHVGGITGFLKSVGFAIKTLHPTRVIIVFDGKGGSQRRRKIYPEYKMKRKVGVRYNRAIHVLTKEDESQSMKMQISRLLQYLDCLPVSILALDNIEADDTIAYMATNPINNEVNNYYIMSSDKDFYQLVNENIEVWSPTKKKLYNPQALLDEYGIHANNFIMYRVLDGDVSDNIDGIKGIGLKTIQKKLPILAEQEIVDIKKLLSYSVDIEGKAFDELRNSKDKLERNFKLMQLKDVDISGGAKLKINNVVRGKISELSNWNFKKLVLEDGINGSFPLLEFWLKDCFDSLNSYAINYAK